MFRPSNNYIEENNYVTPRRVDAPNWRGGYGVGAGRNYAQGHYHSLNSANGPEYPMMEPQMPERQMSRDTVVDMAGFYAYCLDRGNGNFTRLIPADLLPPLAGIPAVQAGVDGMLVLPLPRGPDPHSLSGNPLQPIAFKRRIDHIVASSPTPPKRPKIYCDKWVHEGVCAFTQQGCKYKHEMPLDKATQNSLGLFHGLPAWWKKQQAELQRQQPQTLLEPNGSEAFSDARKQPQSGLVSPIKSEKGYNGLARASQSWRRVEGVKLEPQGQMGSVSSPRQTTGYRPSAEPRSLYQQKADSPTPSCVWGPIGPPSKQTPGQSQMCHHNMSKFNAATNLALLGSLDMNIGEKTGNLNYE
ncbi:uncharacterized protein LY79DRAFT_590044 [Colletotrichum navitas]|uniref:C3H1-type domain-containing protein n=1 Tax=Colletotrichum navitas TaxID=681940 RepID=A0AAD8Q0P1_9PEZI|nr:uncharacterized protein LY79DRAFT_590044 [Colletotrichum navitas]KAK1593201.1 hypothetical protein LY79DRAFT_590044 [Colletotrichum navitas]